MNPHPHAIMHATATRLHVTVEKLMTERTMTPARGRAIAMYLVRKHLGWSYPEIGRFFSRDHTTVMVAELKIRRDLDDPATAGHIAAIEAALAALEAA